MKLSKLIFVFIWLFFIIGCGKDNLVEPFLWSGITITDEYGNTISVDPDDWQNSRRNLANSNTNRPPPPPQPLPADAVSLVYPNPTSTKVNIRYQFRSYSFVRMIFVDGHGRTVKILIDERQSPGYYKVVWNLTDDSGKRVKKGIYRYFFRAGGFQDYGDIEVK